MTRSFRSWPWLVLSGLIPVLATGCSSPTGPAPVPCTQTTAFAGSAEVTPGNPYVQPITTTATGALDVTVNWATDTDIMNVVLAQSPCDAERLAAAGCNVLFSAWSPPKPLRNSTTLLRSGTYVLIVGNPNAAPETISAHVILRSAGCPVS
jgi:hypothetical protein